MKNNSSSLSCPIIALPSFPEATPGKATRDQFLGDLVGVQNEPPHDVPQECVAYFERRLDVLH